MPRPLRPTRPALPRIVQAGHPVLRQVAADVPTADIIERPMRDLVQTMVQTMRAAPGVGLAAPQIGVGLAVIVVEDRREYISSMSLALRDVLQRRPVPLTVMFNPRLTVPPDAGVATHAEGCLSVRGYAAQVTRHLAVVVDGLDATGQPLHLELSGWPARIFQHEIDHLGGTLYVDRMDSRTLQAEDEP